MPGNKRKPAKPKRAVSPQNRGKRTPRAKSGKPDGRGRSEGSRATQFQAGNPTEFKSRAELGGQLDPRINVGGRPRRVREAYHAWLEKVDPKDPEGRTNAEKLAASIGNAAILGDVTAAKEVRSATDGDTLNLSGLDDDQLRGFIQERLARLGIHAGPGGAPAQDPEPGGDPGAA